MLRVSLPISLLACALLLGCQAKYDGQNGSSPSEDTESRRFSSAEDFFVQRIQPRLDFCRSCHIQDGVADTPDGDRFKLTGAREVDYQRMQASWSAMGEGTIGNPLSRESGIDDEPHSGGKPWPQGGTAHNELLLLLQCWDTPELCELQSAGDAPAEKALLGSRRGGHYWFDYCADKADDEPVPQDPRSLVKPGINEGKAVYMNAWWQTCQSDNHPGTCGELRARAERGYRLVASDGEIGAGSFFSGNSADANYAFPASDYAGMWDSIWGLAERPENYDELVAQRWGMPLSPTHNPYPLPGEDPNQSHGGSGQLPMGVTQLRQADGSWTGQLNVTCSICHGGQVGREEDGPGLGAMYGTNSLSDITVMFTDLSQLAPQQGALAMISQNKVRGTGNITNFQLFGTLTLTDFESLPGYLSIQTQPSTGTEDPPVWWNVGSRSAKFFDGGQVMDAKRIELSFHFPNTPFHQDMEADKQWILDHQQDSDAWIMSLKSPAWPEAVLGEIDKDLARQGAILFHSKDLWADELQNPSPRPPGGNGSCASCHGAYSPRYVNDPRYLDDPLLEGIAAHIVPIEVINTDSRRLDGNSQIVAEAARSNWFAYADGPYGENGVSLCADWNDVALRGDRALGYLAPPLYGVWATAPYFHNGAVPNLRAVLKPQERPAIWRRRSVAAPAGLDGSLVMGFDASLQTGYDRENLGWRYEELACGDGSNPYYDCNPSEDDGATLQDGLNLLWENGGLAWNLLNPPIMNDQQIEDRKVYNSYYYSQSRSGHEFSSVLNEKELAALLEYLKTL